MATTWSAESLANIYRISLIWCCGYYLFRCSFYVATIRGRLLFDGGVYFFGNPGDGWIRYIWVRQWRLLDNVSSTRSLSVLLSALRTTRTTQTVLALAWWPSSEIIRTRVRVPCLLAAATIQGRCLSRASDCVATIQGQRLFEEIWIVAMATTTMPGTSYLDTFLW